MFVFLALVILYPNDRLSGFGVSAFSGLECWTGVPEWSTGMESLEWSEALEWV